MKARVWGIVAAVATLAGEAGADGQTLASEATAKASPEGPRGAARPTDEPAHDPTDRLGVAKELFRQGVALLNAGDVEPALDHFLRSRDVVPSGKNTRNAAVCFEKLGRYDEALEMYEELLTRFPDELDEEDRTRIDAAVDALLPNVGSIDVSGNVPGLVVVDGRARGTLPLGHPVRVLAGSHRIRILKDGYESFEARLDVDAGEHASLDASLERLKGVGLVRIEDPANEGSDVYVDGVRVGKAPWEGTLAPGQHVVWTHKGDLGSAPTAVQVLAAQTVLARLGSAPLGPPVEIRTEPEDAEVSLDGVHVGSSWNGRLPVGSYAIAATLPGYHSAREQIVVPLDGGPIRTTLEPEIDASHPRWPKPPPGRIFAGAFGGFAGTRSLGATAERSCSEACRDYAVTGALFGARAGYRFELGIAPEVALGYVTFGTAVRRIVTSEQANSAAGSDVSYALEDGLRIRGPLLGAGASYRFPSGGRFGGVGRVIVGAAMLDAADSIGGNAATTTTPLGAAPEIQAGAGSASTSVRPFIAPEIGAFADVGPVDLGASLEALILPARGPRFDESRQIQTPECDPNAPPTTVCNLPSVTDALTVERPGRTVGERSHGRLVLWAPQVFATYTF